METTQKEAVKTISLEDSLTLIWNALKKSALNGSFDIDESYLIKIGVTCCDDYFYKTETEDIYLNSTPNFIYLYRSLSDKPIKKLIKMNDKKFKLTFKNAIPKNGKIVLNIFITYLIQIILYYTNICLL